MEKAPHQKFPKIMFGAFLVATAVIGNSKFIVKLKETETALAQGQNSLDWAWDILRKFDRNSIVESGGSKITNTYDFTWFKGFTVETSPEAIEELGTHDRVDYWTHDNPLVPFVATPESKKTSSVKSWGLDRVDQRDLPLDGIYKIGPNKGKGVTVYVIDSGIDSKHPEFDSGRAVVGPSFVFGKREELKTKNSDQIGHGSHVAGIIAGKSYGVAPEATVVGLRVYDNTGGGDSGIIAAIDHVIEKAVIGKTVINISIGPNTVGCRSNPKRCNNPLIRKAVVKAYDAGIPVVVAAGNEYGMDACQFAPAGELKAFTVAASTKEDRAADYTNQGSCVDIFAPGSDIVSIKPTGFLSSGVKTDSGTSMAAPHVAGAFALLLSSKSYNNVEALYKDLTNQASNNKLKGVKSNTPNKLLFVK